MDGDRKTNSWPAENGIEIYVVDNKPSTKKIPEFDLCNPCFGGGGGFPPLDLRFTYLKLFPESLFGFLRIIRYFVELSYPVLDVGCVYPRRVEGLRRTRWEKETRWGQGGNAGLRALSVCLSWRSDGPRASEPVWGARRCRSSPPWGSSCSDPPGRPECQSARLRPHRTFRPAEDAKE